MVNCSFNPTNDCRTHGEKPAYVCHTEYMRMLSENASLKKYCKELVDGIVNSPTKHEKLVIETYSNEERLGLLKQIEKLRAVITEAEETIHYEFCSGFHHPKHEKIIAALKSLDEGGGK